MRPLLVAGAVLGLTLLTWLAFPGHTWLQQDTQIYAPILEHLRDPTVLRQEILVQRPHVSFTLYDEVALALRRVTGLDFGSILEAEQFLTRALAIFGVYLMATAAGLAMGPALLVSAILALGATIGGPSVLSLEIEPDPRGFAVPLLLLGIGLIAHGRYLAAGVAGAAAFLIHPPTVYPFWGVFFLLALWPAKPEIMRRRLTEFIPLLAATILLLIASRYQAGIGETQVFFSRLTREQEQLQRMRASYAWISAWARNWVPHYLVIYALGALACFRIRRRVPFDLRFFLIGLPIVGMLSMPLSYVLLERMKWALLPQFQPMRALLFVTVIAVFAAAVAGFAALDERRYFEGWAWFALAYLVPVNTRITTLPPRNRLAVLVLLASGAWLAAWAVARKQRWVEAVLAAAALAGFLLIPTLGGVHGYPRLHTPELEELSRWARAATPRDAVFLFPDAGRDLYPGIFRTEALRAVYVDWKGGGQVNYLRELGEQWWRRWQRTMARPFQLEELPLDRSLGIHYLVFRANHPLAGYSPVFQNRAFVAYCIAP